jgi:hypothetical protein
MFASIVLIYDEVWSNPIYAFRYAPTSAGDADGGVLGNNGGYPLAGGVGAVAPDPASAFSWASRAGDSLASCVGSSFDPPP